jgi:NhaA family Na+:H+ antiporter
MQEYSNSHSNILVVIRNFLKRESFSGLFLFTMAIVAMILANSQYADEYFSFFDTKLGIAIGNDTISMSLLHWINDGLMALFFLIVGVEIKREIIFGELSSIKKASFPIIGAFGGMIVPASIYILFNPTEPNIHGFGIPMATDIAFALGILMLLGDRVPISLKIFLASLAVVDDLGAIIILATFYSHSIDTTALLYASFVVVSLFVINIAGIKKLLVYMILGVVLWVFIHHSGIHATISGIILAIFIPIKAKINSNSFLDTMQTKIYSFDMMENSRQNILLTRPQQDILESIYQVYRDVQNPLLRLQHILHPFTAYFIMPLFAFANAGVAISSDFTYFSSTNMGIIFGLMIGKPIGIFLSVYLCTIIGIIQKPIQLEWNQIFGASLLGGVGFTMSIMVANLAFDSTALEGAKVSVLISSTLIGIIGMLYILKNLPKPSTIDSIIVGK